MTSGKMMTMRLLGNPLRPWIRDAGSEARVRSATIVVSHACVKESPKVVGRYIRSLRPRHGGRQSQRGATFVRNHAHAVVACDFFTIVTASVRVLYVFVVLEVGTRRLLYWNVTEHPTAEWTIQQFRSVITPETPHRFVLHDRDSIFAATVDRAIASMGRPRCSRRSTAHNQLSQRATACKAPRHAWHLRRRRHFRMCNLQNLNGPVGFESSSAVSFRCSRSSSSRSLSCRPGRSVSPEPMNPFPKDAH
jgi:hypothetical protein